MRDIARVALAGPACLSEENLIQVKAEDAKWIIHFALAERGGIVRPRERAGKGDRPMPICRPAMIAISQVFGLAVAGSALAADSFDGYLRCGCQ